MDGIENDLRQALARYERTIAERNELDQRARSERETAIRAAAEAGMTRRHIAEIAGLSFQRVQQIIHDAPRASEQGSSASRTPS